MTEPRAAEPEAPSEPPMPPAPRSRSRWLSAFRVALFLAALAVVGVFATVLRPAPPAPEESPPAPAPTTATPTPPPPPRTPMAFALDEVRGSTLDARPMKAAAREEAAEMQALLGAFFDTAFFDPATWEAGVPDEAWATFAPKARAEARMDAASFSLDDLSADLLSLAPTKATLAVDVLFGPRGAPLAAVARFSIEGDGELEGGERVALVSNGVLLLEPDSGSWVVVGYPEITTELGGPAPDAAAASGQTQNGLSPSAPKPSDGTP